MSLGDKFKHTMQGLKGDAKKNTGKATGNQQWEAEGKTDQVKANLKKAGDNVKDAAT